MLAGSWVAGEYFFCVGYMLFILILDVDKRVSTRRGHSSMEVCFRRKGMGVSAYLLSGKGRVRQFTGVYSTLGSSIHLVEGVRVVKKTSPRKKKLLGKELSRGQTRIL